MANCRAITLNSNPLKLASNTLLRGEGESGAGEDRVFTEKEEEREDIGVQQDNVLKALPPWLYFKRSHL